MLLGVICMGIILVGWLVGAEGDEDAKARKQCPPEVPEVTGGLSFLFYMTYLCELILRCTTSCYPLYLRLATEEPLRTPEVSDKISVSPPKIKTTRTPPQPPHTPAMAELPLI